MTGIEAGPPGSAPLTSVCRAPIFCAQASLTVRDLIEQSRPALHVDSPDRAHSLCQAGGARATRWQPRPAFAGTEKRADPFARKGRSTKASIGRRTTRMIFAVERNRRSRQ